MVPVDTYCNAKSLMVIKTMKRLHIQMYAHPYPLFSKVGRGVGDSEFYSKNFTLVKMEQQNISHRKLLATPLTLTMSAHAHPYLKYSKVISSPFLP
jgi:hypothetical protein